MYITDTRKFSRLKEIVYHNIIDTSVSSNFRKINKLAKNCQIRFDKISVLCSIRMVDERTMNISGNVSDDSVCTILVKFFTRHNIRATS